MRRIRIVLLAFVVALVVVPTALAIRFTDESYNMPTGVVGQGYSKQFDGAGGCGPALPYQYTMIGGNLPPGLSLSFQGLISGTPANAGSWSFWVNLSDQNPPSASWCAPAEAQREFTITVIGGAAPPPPPPAALSISQGALTPKATVLNAPYSFQFSAQGGGTQTWSLQSGSLPAGMTLSSSGLLSGTPTTAGDFSFKVQVADGTRSASQTYSLAVVPRLTITQLARPTGEVARPFNLQLAATGGRPGYTWSVAGGTRLPAGVTLDAATGALAGRPTEAGTFPLKLTVSDALGFTDTVDVELAVAAKLAITTKAISPAKVLRSFRVRLGTSGGVLPRSWTIVRGSLPTGVHLAKRTGVLFGTPRRAGRSTIVLQVKDALGGVSQARFVLTVRPR
jgi:putative Ig domain-containing protein